jgi:hypothetical protein
VVLRSQNRDSDSWEFRAEADTIARPGYPESVAMLVQGSPQQAN